jgi:hypothetical protein
MSKALGVCCLALSFALVVSGSDWDKRTVITLQEPLIVAGVPVVTLEPGTYVMRLVNSPSNRHIVQIFNEREDKLFTTVLAIPNYQLEPKDKTGFAFWETPAGNPPALRAWFYPGDNFGQEFVYPKGLAAKIAQEAGTTVIATPAQTEAELKTAPLEEVNKAGEEKPVPEEALAALAPGLPPLAYAPALEPTPITLPKTASPIFAIGLAGLLALMAGVTLRFAVPRATNR